MLQPPGASRGGASKAYSSNRRKTQESPDDLVRKIAKQNKKCADCGAKLPQCVVISLGIFVCLPCAGIHRELNHRVKGMGHSSFTMEEIQQLQQTSNDHVNSIYLQRYNPHAERMKPPNGNANLNACKAWIKRKYIDRAWYSGGGGGEATTSMSHLRQTKNHQHKNPPAAAPQPTMVQMPPAHQTSTQPAVDLFGNNFDAPAPSQNQNQTKSDDDGWDAFGGSSSAAQQNNNFPPQASSAAAAPSVRKDPFAVPSSSAQNSNNNNFANFDQPMNSGNHNFANFGSSAAATQQHNISTTTNNTQGGDFANFQQGTAPAPQQIQNQSAGFANWNSQQILQQGSQEQPGAQMTMQTAAQNNNNITVPNQTQGGFANFSTQQNHPQGKFSGVPPQQHPQPQQSPNNNNQSGGFANFDQSNQQQGGAQLLANNHQSGNSGAVNLSIPQGAPPLSQHPQGQLQAQPPQQQNIYHNQQNLQGPPPPTLQPQTPGQQQQQQQQVGSATFDQVSNGNEQQSMKVPGNNNNNQQQQQQPQLQLQLNSGQLQQQGLASPFGEFANSGMQQPPGQANLIPSSQTSNQVAPPVQQGNFGAFDNLPNDTPPQHVGGGMPNPTAAGNQTMAFTANQHPLNQQQLNMNGNSLQQPSSSVPSSPPPLQQNLPTQPAAAAAAAAATMDSPPPLTQNPTDTPSVMSAPKEENPMDAFAHLSVNPSQEQGNSNIVQVPAKEAPNPAPTPAIAQKLQNPSKYEAGQTALYISNGTKQTCKILKVHLDDDLEPFYDIQLDGKEKQTDDAHLQELDPLYSKIVQVLPSLTSEQLQQIDQLVSTMTDGNAPGIPQAPSNPFPAPRNSQPPVPAPSPAPVQLQEGRAGSPAMIGAAGGVPSMVVPQSPGNMSHVSQLTTARTVQMTGPQTVQQSIGGGNFQMPTLPEPVPTEVHSNAGSSGQNRSNMGPGKNQMMQQDPSSPPAAAVPSLHQQGFVQPQNTSENGFGGIPSPGAGQAPNIVPGHMASGMVGSSLLPLSSAPFPSTAPVAVNGQPPQMQTSQQQPQMAGFGGSPSPGGRPENVVPTNMVASAHNMQPPVNAQYPPRDNVAMVQGVNANHPGMSERPVQQQPVAASTMNQNSLQQNKMMVPPQHQQQHQQQQQSLPINMNIQMGGSPPPQYQHQQQSQQAAQQQQPPPNPFNNM